MFRMKRCLKIVRFFSWKPRKIRKRAFGRYLGFTNTLSTASLLLLGDMIQQGMEHTGKRLPESPGTPIRYDFGRLLRMSATGFVLGPIQHYFYTTLAKYLPGQSFYTAVKKIIVDQTIMSPIAISIFFISMAIMEKKPLSKGLKELRYKFCDVYKVDLMLGPPSQLINFLFIPVKYQVSYINFVTMVFSVYLSYVKHKTPNKKPKEKVE